VDQTNCSKVGNLEDFEKETFEHAELPDNSTQKDALLPLRPIWLPLVDMFKSRKIEIDLPWNQIEIAYEQLGHQVRLSYAN